MSVLMSTVEVVFAAVGLCKVGDCSDRLGVSPDADGAREQQSVETESAAVCELLLVTVLHRVLHEHVSTRRSPSHWWWLVAWSSGRALVFGRCAFAVLRSTCS